MIIAYVADAHVGNYSKWAGREEAGVNERCRHVLDALELAVSTAVDRGAVVLGILGDLFHTVRVPPQVVAEVQRVLAPIPTFALVGNHDMASMRAGDHAMAPLRDHITVVEEPTALRLDGLDVLAVPFQPGPVEDWLPNVLHRLREECPLTTNATHLALHMGVSDESTPYFLDGSAGSVRADRLAELMDQHGIDAAFAGDWHRHRVWDPIGAMRTIVQVGCLAPNRFPPGAHEHGHIGPLVLAGGLGWSDGLEVLDVPGPRFVKQAWSPGCEVQLPNGARPLYVKLTCSEDDEEAWRELAAGLGARENEVVVDRASAEEAHREAVRVSASAQGVDAAIAAYVEAMPLPDGVDRQNVLRAARGYLR